MSYNRLRLALNHRRIKQYTANGFQVLYSSTNGLGNTAIGGYALDTMLLVMVPYTVILLETRILQSEVKPCIKILQELIILQQVHKLLITTRQEIYTACRAYADVQGITSNGTAIGYKATAGSNQVRVGNTGVTSISGYEDCKYF